MNNEHVGYKMNRCLDKWSIGETFFSFKRRYYCVTWWSSQNRLERANTIVHNEKRNMGDKKVMKAKHCIYVDDLIKRTECICKIDWHSFYKAFDYYNNK